MVGIEKLQLDIKHIFFGASVFPHCYVKARDRLPNSGNETTQQAGECTVSLCVKRPVNQLGITWPVSLRPKTALERTIYLKEESCSSLWCCHVPENPSSNLNCTGTRTITLTDLRTSLLIAGEKNNGVRMEKLLQCGIICSKTQRSVAGGAPLSFCVTAEKKGGQNLSFSGRGVLRQNLFILTYIGWVV